MIPDRYRYRTVTMNAKQKKEIEAKWQRLMAGADTKSSAKTAGVPAGAMVIRRRKGQEDLPICSGSKYAQ